MKYEPKTQKEISEMSNWPEGECPFTVTNAADTVSKRTGKEMIQLELHVFNPAGVRKEVTDYLVPGTNFGDRKIFEACRALGLSANYASGNLGAVDFVDKSGYLKLGIDKGKAKDGGGEWPDKNCVKFYITKKADVGAANKNKPTDAQLSNTSQGKTDLDEDVPF